MLKLRENRKLKESEMPRKDRESLVERRRKANREYVKKHRERKKAEQKLPKPITKLPSYKAKQTLEKAVNKAIRALSNSP